MYFRNLLSFFLQKGGVYRSNLNLLEHIHQVQFIQPSLIIMMHPNVFAAVNYLPSKPILKMNITHFNYLAYREGLTSCRSSCMRCKIGICHAWSVLTCLLDLWRQQWPGPLNGWFKEKGKTEGARQRDLYPLDLQRLCWYH